MILPSISFVINILEVWMTPRLQNLSLSWQIRSARELNVVLAEGKVEARELRLSLLILVHLIHQDLEVKVQA